MQKSKQSKEIKLAVIELYETKERFKQVEQDYESKKKELENKIRSYMSLNKLDSFNLLTKNRPFKITNVKQRKIIFDIPKLEKVLDVEILKEIIKKEYHVNDWDGLVKYLKSCGVNPKKFKSFIEVSKQVDSKRLDELGELGEIQLQDLQGCYTVNENVGYIKITETEE